MLYNPLEQFKILVFQKIAFGNIDLSITNNTIILFIMFVVFGALYCINSLWNTYIPNKWQFALENIYIFVLEIFKQQVGNIMALRYFPLVLFIFTFILMSNLMGLLPYGFTITGHIIFTFQIAFSLFFGITIINIVNNQFGFLKIFMPTGVPVFLVPFLVIIEVVSYLIRPFSLSVRLFANMLAGHTLLKILSISTFALMKRYMLLSIFPLLFIVFISILELGIAIVQAYIFTILVSIYINDIYSAH